MLSGFVNKYLNERGTFETDVCSYQFGLGDNSYADERNEVVLEADP